MQAAAVCTLKLANCSLFTNCFQLSANLHRLDQFMFYVQRKTRALKRKAAAGDRWAEMKDDEKANTCKKYF